eukprot:Opistho-2@91031
MRLSLSRCRFVLEDSRRRIRPSDPQIDHELPASDLSHHWENVLVEECVGLPRTRSPVLQLLACRFLRMLLLLAIDSGHFQDKEKTLQVQKRLHCLGILHFELTKNGQRELLEQPLASHPRHLQAVARESIFERRYRLSHVCRVRCAYGLVLAGTSILVRGFGGLGHLHRYVRVQAYFANCLGQFDLHQVDAVAAHKRLAALCKGLLRFGETPNCGFQLTDDETDRTRVRKNGIVYFLPSLRFLALLPYQLAESLDERAHDGRLVSVLAWSADIVPHGLSLRLQAVLNAFHELSKRGARCFD